MAVQIRIRIHTERLLSALATASDSWSQEKGEGFVLEWRALEEAGAEIADVKFMPDGRVVGFPSEEFIAHCAKYGVYPKEA